MDPVEKAYRDGIAAWSGAQRVARSVGLLCEIREMLLLKVQREHPELDERAHRILVAKSLYRNDPEILRWLDRIER